MSDPSQSILIIGAGVFGLSTALFLARRGYKDITVIDRLPFDKNHYSPSAGCDGASADINKVFRTGYGDRKMYERLAYKALPVWQEWTKAVHESRPEDLPDGLSPEDTLLVLCGVMRLGEGKEVSQYYRDILDGVEEDGRRDRVYMLQDEDDHSRAVKEDAERPGMSWSKKLRRYGALRGGDIHGMLDMDTGFTRADKCCVYALHLCKQAGVKFILDEKAGRFERFIKKGQSVLGVITSDGKEHRADKTIVACGAWTASVVPEARTLLETTGGSLCFVDIPSNRPDLLKRFGPEEFCGWSLKLESPDHDVNAYRSMGGFPADPSGRLKFGFRSIKYTNYETHSSGARLSVPRTKYSDNPIQNIPKEALEAMKSNIMAVYPELTGIGITDTRLCWYTDTIDNHFVGDYVPNTNDTLFIASGGSGHGFKFLPVFGEHFANGLEKKEDEFTQYWKWRTPKPGQWANGLEEGELGPRVLNKVEIATKADWKFDVTAITKQMQALKA